MSQPTPMPAAERSGPDEVYRPISGLAIASFIVAAIFGALVLVNGGAGLLEGMPLMLSSWLLLLPVAGVVLAILGRRQIRSSEGTRAGQRLTSWGLWLSVLFGLGYGAYSIGIYFVVRHQVQDFLFNAEKGFFADLKKSDGINAAFLLTLPPETRGNISDQDTQRLERTFKQTLMRFRDSQLVRIVHQGQADTQVQPQSEGTLKYEQGGFSLEVTVYLITPEHSVPFAVTVRSKDGSGPGAERWFVDMTRCRQLEGEMDTERGHALRQLRLLSHDFVIQWLVKLHRHDIASALKDTAVPADFAPGGKAIRKDVPEEELRKKIDQMFDPDAKGDVPFEATLTCCMKDTRRATSASPPPAYWQLSEDKKHLQVLHDFTLIFEADPAKGSKVIFAGHVIAERKDSEPFSFNPKRPPGWRIVRLEVTAYHEMAPGEGTKGPKR